MDVKFKKIEYYIMGCVDFIVMKLIEFKMHLNRIYYLSIF